MSYKCENCNGNFKNPQALKIHQKTHGILEPITGGNTEMTDTYCKDCYSKDQEFKELKDDFKELKNKSEENLEKLKIDANQNQGHISAKELISCQSHGPDAIKELNESFVMYPKDVIRNGGKKLEIAKSLFPELADIIENGITLPDELFTNKHS